MNQSREYNKLLETLRVRFGWAKVEHSQNGRFITTVCPVCGKRKLAVDSLKGTYRCWRGCGWGYIDKLLGRKFNIKRTDVPPEIYTPPVWIPPGDSPSLLEFGEDSAPNLYLKGRGYDPTYLAETYSVRFCSDGKYFGGNAYSTHNTLIFPILVGSECIAWQSRLLYDPKHLSDAECVALGMTYSESGRLKRFPKYFTMPGYKKGMGLYNIDQATQSNLVVIVEGVFDVFAVGKCAVATFGKEITSHQVGIVANNWNTAVILLDDDADNAAGNLVSRLGAAGVKAVSVHLPDGKDAGETSQSVIWDSIANICGKAGIDIFQFELSI